MTHLVGSAELDGIQTHYEVRGEGPPILMFSPGGFDGQLHNWESHGLYARTRPLDHLVTRYQCILFDKRESGASGGRVQRIRWTDYVEQGRALLDHLGIRQAYVMGGCVGCSIASRFAVEYPERTLGLILVSPAGGTKYRMLQHARFAQHESYVKQEGLRGVVELANSSLDTFSKDGRLGPWASSLRNDAALAATFADGDLERYMAIVTGTVRGLFDRDTVPGVEPEDLMVCELPALIVPGHDPSHARSAAWHLEECLPNAQMWDVPVVEQTASNLPERITEFLRSLA